MEDLIFYTVYKTINLINNMEYIGKHQSKKLIDDYLGSGKELVKAIEVYGRDNFEKEILFVFKTEEEMNAKEKEIVTEEYCDSDLTYNLCPGGHGGFGYINSLERTWKPKGTFEFYSVKGLKIRDDKVGIFDPEVKRKLNLIRRENLKDAFKGKKHKNETIEYLSIIQSGSKNSQYGTMWITDGHINKKIKKDSELPFGFRKGRVF